MTTGEIRFEGPIDEQGKALFNAIFKRRADIQLEVTYYLSLGRREKDPRPTAIHLDEWHHEQKMFDIINDVDAAVTKQAIGTPARC